MMLPSLASMLSNTRRSVRGPDDIPLERLTALAGAGYFFVWAVFGAAAYPLGAALAAAEMRWPALAASVPLATGAALLLAGGLQLTPWKFRQLVCCREAPPCDQPLPLDARSAWRHGLGLGVHCCLCCAGFMLILLASGVMNLGVMAAVAAAITLERLAPGPERVARAVGLVVVAAGALAIARALGAA
jgi:predicted metal-binding membrane protein